MAAGRQRFSIISDGLPTQLPDIDPDETREWVDSFDSVVRTRGRARARYVMLRLLERAREQQVGVPGLRSTDYINTIPPEREPWFPGDEYVERRIRAYIRWNAAVMVSRANRAGLGVGGHIATYASAASLYEVGFNHFFRGKDHGESGDQVFIQGHAAPGHLRPRVPGGPPDRAAAQRLPAGTVPPRRRAAVLPAPAADAGLLGVPHGLHGPRPAERHLPGAVQPVPARPGDRRHQQVARMGIPRRRRGGRAGGARRHRPGRPRGTGQPHLRDQLQPAAAGRPCPRQRQDHPGARGGVPRRRLERDQGHLGPGLGSAARPGHRRRAGQQDEHHARRAVPDLRGGDRRVHQGELLRRRPAAARHGLPPERRPAPQPVPRRARLPQGLRRVQGGDRARRPADGDPGPHHQGLDARPGLRGPQRHPPDEEAHRRRAEGVQGPAVPAHP